MIGIDFTTKSRLLTTLKNETFRKHCGKWRKCWLQAFSPFPSMFSTLPKTNFNFSVLCCCLQMLSISTSLKFCHLVKVQNVSEQDLTLYSITKCWILPNLQINEFDLQKSLCLEKKHRWKGGKYLVTLSQMTNSDSFKLKEFVDDNFKFD